MSALKHRLWVLARTAPARRFYQIRTIYVLSRNMKTTRILNPKVFIFFAVKFSIYLNRHVFVMPTRTKHIFRIKDASELRAKLRSCKTRPRGYKTFFMLISAEHGISLLVNMKMPTIVGIFIFICKTFSCSAIFSK